MNAINNKNFENEMTEEPVKKKLLTIKEAADLVEGLTEYRIRQMCKSGQLPCFKAGRKYLIIESVLYEIVFKN